METKRLVIVAVGGQGNLLASSVLGEAAMRSGIPLHMSEIHGMAQRGGVVESSLVFGDATSTIISEGEADILVGFEPAETLRAIGKCNANTVVITNLAPLMPFTVNIGQGVYPDLKKLQELIRSKTAKLIAFNAATSSDGRPRYLISDEELDAFKRRRQAVHTPPRVKTSKRRKPVKKYV